MKIALDHQIFSMQRYGGISRYFSGLHDESILDTSCDIQYCHLFSSNEYLNDRNIALEKLPLRLQLKINQYYGQLKRSIKDFDIVHRTFYYETLSERSPTVLTVYDMINEKFPEYFPNQGTFLELKKKAILNSDLLIAISESTKNDLIKIYNVDESKIVVTHLSDSLETTVLKDQDINLPQDYILFVGNRDGYKNFDLFVDAVSDILIENNIMLLCAGGPSFTKTEIEKLESLKINNLIQYYKFHNNEELKYIYSKAKLFVFPSLYEGFGIPILEAMGVGTPVALSYSSSFPEVAGEAGIYFDPYSKQSIYDSIINNIDNKNKIEHQYLIKSVYSKFSNSKVFKKTKKGYEILINN